MTYFVKKRTDSSTEYIGTGRWGTVNGGTIINPTLTSHFRVTKQSEMLGFNNSQYRKKIREGRKVGLNFRLIKSEAIREPSAPQSGLSGTRKIENVQFYNPLSSGPWVFTSPNLIPYMSTLYERMRPDRPEFNFGVSIAELKDLPRLFSNLQEMMSKRPNTRTASKAYLDWQFGVKPIINDIKNLLNAAENVDKRLRQLIRDNGKPVRRRMTITLSDSQPTNTRHTSYGVLGHILPTQFYDYVPYEDVTTKITESVTGVARFRYHLPTDLIGRPNISRIKRKLYGLDFNASNVYAVVPFSWLVDWFTNLGTIIASLSNGVADRLAADYFYIIYKREEITTKVSQGSILGQPVSCTSVHTRKWYERVEGTPFHPSITGTNLNNTQLAILGALGHSRLPSISRLQ